MEKKIYTGEQKKKPVRSLSGVMPLTVVLKPRKCNHGTCVYCPGGDHVPQSYTDKSPAIMRAMRLAYDPFVQVTKRLEALKAMNHPTDKIELILLGGTFLQYDLTYQYDFVKRCFDALNEANSQTLQEAQEKNETSAHRCVALCIENRPDNCSIEEIKRMREFGCTRVEIGVQNPDDEIYKKINRGHSVKDVIDATRRLKNAGFKVGYHIMPGLPFSTYKKDVENTRLLFTDERFRPDQLKIYPCQIIEDSPLAKIHKELKYQPYDRETTKKIVGEIIALLPPYCRVMRVMREIPKEKLVEGVVRLDVRKEVEETLKKEGVSVQEIRMREIGFQKPLQSENLTLRTTTYEASSGEEYFLEIVDENNTLYALLRLRFPTNTDLKELKDCALIRELHVYGQALKLGEKGEMSQHKGLGKTLMNKAEKIAIEKRYKKLAVISGIGVRDYYRKLGYQLEGTYMIKRLRGDNNI